MDVVNEQAIHDKVIDPAITRLNTETIPAIQKALGDVLDRSIAVAITNASDLISVASAEVQGKVNSLTALVASLDGWTLDIAIPPITIRLSKPKQA